LTDFQNSIIQSLAVWQRLAYYSFKNASRFKIYFTQCGDAIEVSPTLSIVGAYLKKD